MSLVKYYYMDIPLDICAGIKEFENTYSANLLGPDWHEYLFDSYENFRENSRSKNKGEEYLKAEFSKQALAAFYEAMGSKFGQRFLADEFIEQEVLAIVRAIADISWE